MDRDHQCRKNKPAQRDRDLPTASDEDYRLNESPNKDLKIPGLGWRHSYGGVFRLTMRMPRLEEMKKLIEAQLAVKDRYERRRGFSILGNPTYLKSLRKALENESDEGNIDAAYNRYYR
jgi:hypothetical protein